MTESAVNRIYQDKSGLLGQRPFFLTVERTAMPIRDKGLFKAHWTEGSEKWGAQDPQTPGLILIQVIGEPAQCWDRGEEGKLMLEGTH